MKRVEYPAALKGLIDELKRLPGVGPRSAERIALWMVQKRDAKPDALARSIENVQANVRPCRDCGFFASGELCEICEDPARDRTSLCVVEQPTDILPLERSGAFRGIYHALGGRISPLDHIGPEDLRIDSLIHRVRATQFHEIILALGSDVEGEATASYLASTLHGLENSPGITRLAQGLPAGGGLEFADELTLSRAISGRTKI